MKKLILEIGKYEETASTYKELVGVLAKIYQLFKLINEDVSSKTKNDLYLLHYTDIEEVEKILMGAYYFAPTKEETNNITIRK